MSEIVKAALALAAAVLISTAAFIYFGPIRDGYTGGYCVAH